MSRLDLIWLTNSGISGVRITRVRPMIDSAQDAPPSGSKNVGAEQLVEADQDREDRAVQRLHDEVPMVPTIPDSGVRPVRGPSGLRRCPRRRGRHGVVAAGGPRVAAPIRRTASQLPRRLPCSVDRLERVGRARRVVAAHLAVERADQRRGRPGAEPISRYFTTSAPSGRGRRSTHRPSRPLQLGASSRPTRPRRAAPGPRLVTRGRAAAAARARCRSRRLTRLRITALPTALLTTSPTRPGLGRPRISRAGAPTRVREPAAARPRRSGTESRRQ